jgi:hypothetical protein
VWYQTPAFALGAKDFVRPPVSQVLFHGYFDLFVICYVIKKHSVTFKNN